MAHVSADRVRDTSTSTGTGAFVVSGTAPTAFRTFSAVLSTSDTFYYAIQHQTVNEWEVGLGTYSSANTITRTTVYASSAGGSAVTFSSGTKDVFITLAATRSVQLDNNGNVGIGTSSPTQKLDVYAASGVLASTVRVAGTTGSDQAFVIAQAGSNVAYMRQDGNGGSFLTAPNNWAVFTNSGERMRIDASGNVLVGAAAQAFAEKFQVYGNYSVFNNASYTGFIGQGSSLGTATASDFAIRSSNALAFLSGGATERMRIDSSGNVGIGTSSPSSKLHVNGGDGNNIRYQGATDTIAMGVVGTTPFVGTLSNAPLAFLTNVSERARIDSSGNLLVACTGTNDTASTGLRYLAGSNGYLAHTLEASTNGAGASYYLYSTGAGSYRFYVGAGGTVFATSTTISAISDQRLKENVRDLDDGLNVIMSLKPRKFDWKEGKGKDIKDDRGFIAQEFEQVFPDLIDEWKDPAPEGEEPYKAVRADLIPVLVKAVQELKTHNDELKARVAALENA
jgi:hypothetical protein